MNENDVLLVVIPLVTGVVGFVFGKIYEARRFAKQMKEDMEKLIASAFLDLGLGEESNGENNS